MKVWIMLLFMEATVVGFNLYVYSG